MDIRRRTLSGIIENGESGGDTIINNYLTIEALEDGLTAKLSVNSILYCIDGDDNWVTLSADTLTPSINKGLTISFKGNLSPNNSSGIGTFTISKSCNLLGNCMSLLYGDDASINYSLSGKNYVFCKLFLDCTTIKNAHNLILPATTLANYSCYLSMFEGCTSLITTPELPATTLKNSCYLSMFYGCSSLTTAPELPAMTLASYCYLNMFYGCSSLTTAPELPAMTLESYCYGFMFYGCTRLTTAPELPATTLTLACYTSMFRDCSSLTTAPELPATTLASKCYDYMFYGCSSLTTAPELPATTLTGSYSYMFYGCSSLTTAPELPATTLISSCYKSMFYGCSSLTTAPELPAMTLESYCYLDMFYGCSKLNYIKMLATDVPRPNCLSGWVYKVSSTGTFVKNPAMTTLPSGNNGIPSGWTVVDNT